jgi:hypothetical protein
VHELYYSGSHRAGSRRSYFQSSNRLAEENHKKAIEKYPLG